MKGEHGGSTSDGMTIHLHTLDEETPPGWDAFLTREELHAAWDWTIMRAMRAGQLERSVVAVLRVQGEIEGIVTGRLNGPRRGGPWLCGVLDVDSLCTSFLPGYTFSAGWTAERQGTALDDVEAALAERYGRRLLGVCYRQVSAQDLPHVASGASVVRPGRPIAVFDNTFADSGEYLASLSKQRRKGVRRFMRDVEARGVDFSFTETGGDRVEVDVVDACALQASVVERNHSARWLRKRFLGREYARALLTSPGVARMTYHDPRGQLTAYSLIWRHSRRPAGACWGMRAVDEGGVKNLWFHHLAAQALWCVNTGREQFLSGQGTLDLKREFGFVGVPQWAVLKPLPRR